MSLNLPNEPDLKSLCELPLNTLLRRRSTSCLYYRIVADRVVIFMGTDIDVLGEVVYTKHKDFYIAPKGTSVTLVQE